MAEPKVRFKRDDGNSYLAWKTSSFSKTFNALNNNTYSRDLLNYDGGDAKNIHYGDILVKFGDICDIQKDIIPYVNEGLAIQKYASLKDGDIILADTAEDEAVGKAVEIYNIKNDVVISGLHTLACRPVNSFAPKYLGYCMNSPGFHNQLRPFMQGVKVTSIGRSNISDVQISSPSSLEEQQKIADFLSSVDEVISTSEAEVANLETQKKAVMKKIFSREVRFRREDGSDFPEWEETTIGEVGDVITGSTPSTKDDDNYGHDYCFCAPGDLGNGKYVVNTEKKVSEKGFKSGRAIPHGSVLATCIGSTIGKMGIAGCDMITNQQINSIIVKDDDPEYIYYAVGHCFPQYLSSVGKQAVPILSKSEFSKKSIPLPCLEEQRLIADFLSSFDEAIAAAKKELELWKELKKGLLQQMFV